MNFWLLSREEIGIERVDRKYLTYINLTFISRTPESFLLSHPDGEQGVLFANKLIPTKGGDALNR